MAVGLVARLGPTRPVALPPELAVPTGRRRSPEPDVPVTVADLELAEVGRCQLRGEGRHEAVDERVDAGKVGIARGAIAGDPGSAGGPDGAGGPGAFASVAGAA
jgi:hypothetical protein